jgi:hypothetical protein
MFVSAVNSIRGGSPIRKTEKTAKVEKRAITGVNEADGTPVEPPVANDARRRDPDAAPKSPEAMSSAAVQAALTFLKTGR